MNYRRAEVRDIPVLADLRKKQLIDEGQKPDLDVDYELADYFQKKMSDRSLVEWVAEEDGRIIATGAIIFMDFPPSFTNKTGKTGVYCQHVYGS